MPRVKISSPVGLLERDKPSDKILPLALTLVGLADVRVAVPPEIE